MGNGKIRRELGVLSAAINYWHEAHGPLDAIPVVTLPQKPPPRERWLLRSEATVLVAAALGFYRVFWSDARTRRRHMRWERYAGGINRHLARFILLGLYTGTRRTAMFDVQWMANTTGGWVDLTRGVLYRKSATQEESTKRQTPTKLGRKISAHLRRWKAIDEDARRRANRDDPGFMHVVAWMGRRVSSVRTAWEAAVELAWLDDSVTPHVLRHTRATWLMQAGIDPFEAAGSLGMSVKTLNDVYGHHHPDFQARAAEV